MVRQPSLERREDTGHTLRTVAQQLRHQLHRARTGGHEMHEAAHTAEPGGAPTGAAGAVHERAGSTESHGEAAAGYAALRAKGLTHHEIVEKLAREALMAMEHGAASRAMRYGDKKSFT